MRGAWGRTLIGLVLVAALPACLLPPPDDESSSGLFGPPSTETVDPFPVSPPSVPCPPSGYLVWAGGIDAAMGQRFLGVNVTNCGDRPVRLTGFPRFDVLDDQDRPVPVAVGREGDAGAAVTIGPGEAAVSTLSWRLVVEAGGRSRTSAALLVEARPGEPAQRVVLRDDLGTGPDLRATAWQRRG